MKRILLIFCLAFGMSQALHAQLGFGIKGGINYNSDSFSEVKNDVLSGAKSKTGFHAGIWLRAKIPVVGLYIRPELIYTQLGNQVNYSPTGTTTTETDFTFKKIDVPVLLGKKFLGVGNVFVGPSFQYILGSDFGFSDLKSVDSDGFTVGLVVGAGIEVSKLGLDIRYERGFNDVASSFMDGTTNVNFDTRVNQIIIGLSYQF